MGRLGQVLYGLGCGLGILSIFVAVWVFYGLWSQWGFHGATFFGVGLCLGAGLVAWLAGIAARFILKGD